MMWKLFSQSWIDRLGVYAELHVQAVADLERYWRGWLEGALHEAGSAASGDDVAEMLRRLSGRKLLVVEDRMRHNASREWFPATARSPGAGASGAVGSSVDRDERDVDAFLFVASCHWSGYVREHALGALAHRPGSLALAAGLIRSTDWVPQVQIAAIALVKGVLPQLPPGELIRHLDLIVGLRERLRVPLDLWQKTLVPKIRLSKSRDALRAVCRDLTVSASTRQVAYGYLLSGAPEEMPEVLRDAVTDTDPRLGLWAVEQVSAIGTLPEVKASTAAAPGPRELRCSLLKFALRNRHTAVRSAALRQLAAEKPNDIGEVLRASALDPARGVRAIAAFELDRVFGESALPVWRAALMSAFRNEAGIAILALCELGERGDVEALLTTKNGKWNGFTRAALLRGLWRVDSALLAGRLAAALSDSSKVVLRQVAEIYRRGRIPLDPQLLELAVDSASEHTLPTLLTMTAGLGKWSGLEFLLRQAVKDDHARAHAAAELIDRWGRNSNRGFGAVSADRANELMELLRAAQRRHPERNWRAVELTVSAFT